MREVIAIGFGLLAISQPNIAHAQQWDDDWPNQFDEAVAYAGNGFLHVQQQCQKDFEYEIDWQSFRDANVFNEDWDGSSIINNFDNMISKLTNFCGGTETPYIFTAQAELTSNLDKIVLAYEPNLESGTYGPAPTFSQTGKIVTVGVGPGMSNSSDAFLKWFQLYFNIDREFWGLYLYASLQAAIEDDEHGITHGYLTQVHTTCEKNIEIEIDFDSFAAQVDPWAGFVIGSVILYCEAAVQGVDTLCESHDKAWVQNNIDKVKCQYQPTHGKAAEYSLGAAIYAYDAGDKLLSIGFDGDSANLDENLVGWFSDGASACYSINADGSVTHDVCLDVPECVEGSGSECGEVPDGPEGSIPGTDTEPEPEKTPIEPAPGTEASPTPPAGCQTTSFPASIWLFLWGGLLLRRFTSL